MYRYALVSNEGKSAWILRSVLQITPATGKKNKKVKLERLLLVRWIRPWSSKVVNQVTETKFADKKVAAVRKWEINYKYLAKDSGTYYRLE